jgi:histidinol phosphatase-like PHP family hydrolase
VARTALEVGAALLVNTDTHGPSDLITRHQAERIARGAGLTDAAVQTLFAEAENLARRLAEL